MDKGPKESKDFIKQITLLKDVTKSLGNIDINRAVEYLGTVSNIAKLDKNDTCPQHGLELECYCMDCDKILCAKCTVREHRSHEIQALEESLAYKTKEADNYEEISKIKSSAMQENQFTTQKNIDQVHKAKANTMRCIKDQADKLRKTIDKDEKVLIAKVEQQTKQVLDILHGEKNKDDREITSHIPDKPEAGLYYQQFTPSVFNLPENIIGDVTFNGSNASNIPETGIIITTVINPIGLNVTV
jgi:hypothetical protein